MRLSFPAATSLLIVTVFSHGLAFAQGAVPASQTAVSTLPPQYQYTPAAEPDILKGTPQLQSAVALIVDQADGKVLYAKNQHYKTPIASITKLMTAMVVLDSNLPMEELITITSEEIDYLKSTSSRLQVGLQLSRLELLQLALMASENRAAAALGRSYPGGTQAFVAAMNRKAASLGMANSQFADSSGLDTRNTATAEDLVKMVRAAYRYKLISDLSTAPGYYVVSGDRYIPYKNTNKLVTEKDWVIGLSKTGYINESGRCLVMQTLLNNKPVIMVLLDSAGKFTRIADAIRVKQWVEGITPTRLAASVMAPKQARVTKQDTRKAKQATRMAKHDSRGAKQDKRKRIMASFKAPHYR